MCFKVQIQTYMGHAARREVLSSGGGGTEPKSLLLDSGRGVVSPPGTALQSQRTAQPPIGDTVITKEPLAGPAVDADGAQLSGVTVMARFY